MEIKLFLLLATFIVYCSSAPRSDEDRSYMISVLEKVPEGERRQFIIHQLYLGYVLNHPEYVAIPVPEEVTLKIYDLFLRDYLIVPIDQQVYSQLCFPSGECVDTDDPGVYP